MSEPTIIQMLFSLEKPGYREFQSRLMPGFPKERIIGVPVPELRAVSRSMLKAKDPSFVQAFLKDLPHQYYEENNLHGLIISATADYSLCIRLLNDFLPYVDNWATCDLISPVSFPSHKKELYEEIRRWIVSPLVYTVRFAIDMMIKHFMKADFKKEHLLLVNSTQQEDYYIQMAVAWYFATALTVRYDAALPFVENGYLKDEVRKMAIQKAVDSRQIPDERKKYLKSLRIR